MADFDRRHISTHDGAIGFAQKNGTELEQNAATSDKPGQNQRIDLITEPLGLFPTRANERLAQQFPILNLDRKQTPLTFFDHASTSHKPMAVIDRLANFYKFENSNVHRGLYELSAEATEAYEQARETLACFTGVETENFIFTSGTTASINLLARGLEDEICAGDLVLVSELEHHSNLLPWLELCSRKRAELQLLTVNNRGEIESESLERLLETGRVKILAVTGLSHVLGNVPPYLKFFEMAQAHGALCLLDGAQMGLGLEKLMESDRIDAVAFSGHKLHAPFGIGALAISARLRDKLKPVSMGGGMLFSLTESLSSDKIIWSPLPHRFEAGTPPVGEAIAFACAIQFMQTDLYRQAAQVNSIDLLAHPLSQMPSVQLYGWANALNHQNQTRSLESVPTHGPIFSFAVEGQHPHDVAQSLADAGIAVRAGLHCAQPLMHRLSKLSQEIKSKTFAHGPATNFGTVRVSLSPTTTHAEIDRFLNVMENLTSQAVRARTSHVARESHVGLENEIT